MNSSAKQLIAESVIKCNLATADKFEKREVLYKEA